MLNEHFDYVPHPLLRPLVASMTGYRHEGLPPGVHRGVPSPGLTLVITIDEPVVLTEHADPVQAPEAYDALVGGLHTRPALIAHNGRQYGVQLSLTPLGARALLGAPAGVIAVHDLADVLGGPGTELIERVRAATDWAGRLAAVEEVLLRLARQQVTLAPEVGEAWRLTTQTYGRLRVEEIARRVGWSARHLGERFRAEIGLTPKEAGRVARFDRARGLLVRRVGAGRSADLVTLATVCGYADQAHLTREWRSLSGLSPSKYLAAELGFVQDNAVQLGAESSA
ncbi:MAG: helix-turn-helix domain-containing protein [Actinomycetota bacterium]|nr:helix-turn-helix domain-containing protein [Actinomycetota bacterium]